MSIRINDLTVRFKNGVVAVNKASLEIDVYKRQMLDYDLDFK